MKTPKAQVKKSSHNKQLYEKLENLEEEWDSYKRVKPRSHLRRKRRCSTGGSFSEYSIVTTSLHDQLLENSPRSLMSSLQENRIIYKSPISDDEGLIWKVRNNDIAVQEILNERRDALASGKLKGRRLFEGSGDGEEVCSDCFDNLFQEIDEVRSLESYGSDNEDDDKKCFEECFVSYGGNHDQCLDDSSLSEEEMGKDLSLMEGEKAESANVNEKKRVYSFGANLGRKNINGGRWRLGMAWFAVVTMALTLGLISMSCKGGNLEEEKAFLIPT